MNISQRVFELIRAILQKWIDGCKDCGGSGMVQDPVPDKLRDMVDAFPCPTCQSWRALIKERLCWHEVVGSFQLENERGYNIGIFGPVCSCGKKYASNYSHKEHCEDENPDLTTAMKGTCLLIVWIMMEAGLWEGFEHWMWNESGKCQPVFVYIDGSKLVPAIKAFLEGRKS